MRGPRGVNKPGSGKSHEEGSLPAASVLIVEEEAKIREFVSAALRLDGYRVAEAASGEQAISVLADGRFDLVISDVSLPDIDGAELLRTAKRMTPDIELVVMVSEKTAGRGLGATRDGAYDYLMKPFPSDRLLLVTRRALERRSLVKKVRVLEETIRGRAPFEGIVGTSRTLTEVMKIVEQVARMDNTVLVSGEPGTGKKLIARALHALSARNEKPFTVINCGATPEGLQDEIFGLTRATPNGARLTQRGLLEQAHGGTVFLDDVVELTPPAQRSMLRFLQESEARRGSAAPGPFPDVRVIAATDRNLEDFVEAGSFNEDLYYRLNVISLRVPPLRERTEDIPLLARHFLRQAGQSHGGGQFVISPRAMSVLTVHPWKDNVRELENVIQRAVALDRDGVLGLDDLPFSAETAADKVIDRAKSASLSLGELEREYVLEVLAECGGSRKKTAAKLGITTATLWRKLRRFEKGD
ncbi:MAG TPA: sigma-54 dependent transcriptional regulator [Vicinamibacteria bacterium]